MWTNYFSNIKTLTRTGMTANSVLACCGLNNGEERERKKERKTTQKWAQNDTYEGRFEFTQLCRPLPRDFGHFVSPSWFIMEKSTRYKMKTANEGKKTSWKKMESPGICSMYERTGEYSLYFSQIYKWLSIFLKWISKSKVLQSTTTPGQPLHS